MAYLPIEEYGIVGNMRTCAPDRRQMLPWTGSAAPTLIHPAFFGAILDDKKGGYFKIAPLLDAPAGAAPGLLARHQTC